MQARKSSLLVLVMLIGALASAGCVDFLREGITQGVEEGVASGVSSVFEFFIAAVAGGT